MQGGDESEDGGWSVSDLVAAGMAAYILIPVAIILVVMVAVAFGGVLGTLGLSDGGESPDPPNASFQYELDAGLVVTHDGGDRLTATDVEIVVNGGTVGTWLELNGDLPVAEGSSVVVTTGVEPGDRVRIVWVGGGERHVLDTHTVGEYTLAVG